MIIVLCFVVALLAAPSLAQGSGGSTLTSPCPRLFRYAPPGIEPGLWAGVATLSTDIFLHSMWLNIVLDRPAQGFGQLWHSIGNTTTQDYVDFRIYNDDLQIHPDHPLVVRFYVQYDPLNTTPRLREMRLNGRVICNDDTYQRATVDRPVLSNVRQPSSSVSDPEIRTNHEMKPLKLTQSNNNPVYQRPVNTPTRTSGASFKPENSYPNTSAPAESVGCGIVLGGNDRITGSKIITYRRGDLPWLIAIYHRLETTYSLKYICGGTLVSDRHVITSANCMQLRRQQTAIKDFVVKVGAHNVNDWTEDVTVTRKLVSVSIHEDYDSSNFKSNILILTLSKRVQFNDFIRPACLWSGDTELSRVVGTSGIVAGWGVLSKEDTGRHDEPHIVRATIVSIEECLASHNAFRHITPENTFCAGDRNGDGPCIGSSGSGLFLLQDGRWTLRALTSVSLRSEDGDATCNLNEYVVYTDTAQFLPWIKNILSVQYID